ncbi:hypothetical protein CspeluHIS016_0300860 [Cutaneotrichosporon spelunceum]|uniref:Phosphatidic acid phosphatase type 2/haloperoxidase domain-containing protein n=1 Tax=Cutaneotrichosporon spelunceum TaxID=1672016 RepID=A0AAD3TSP9_9TREE|nr:hypothetical protein CspeluHIS016_0300860 [Cutaneotrichosporon spelunceum]
MAATEDAPPKKVYVEAGLQPDTVYAAALAPWRDRLRRYMVESLSAESEWIASVQREQRTRGRDKFFFWSAVFGTHTFFTAFLPLLFFLGQADKARGLVFVVGIGIYLSCVVKDIVCTPRPFSPPVTRLSVSTHHREYGFPSSHSTNSISIALFLGQWLWEQRELAGSPAVVIGWIGLAAYFLSVAGGRIYTGMHSIPDVIGGTLLGTICWVIWVVFGTMIGAWIESGSLSVPIVMVPLTLGLVHYHPETPDDCPCFEDAIAILAVILGVSMGWLLSVREPQLGVSINVWRYGILWAIPAIILRVVLGIGTIFLWRLVMKRTLLTVLPPAFRLFSKVLDVPLPTRRFYLPATKYNEAETPIRPIPSFAELGNLRESSPGSLSPALAPVQPIRSPSPLRFEKEALHIRLRQAANGNASASGSENGYISSPEKERAEEHKASRARKRPTTHYDAEVLTKVVVYTGIGLLASTLIPSCFPAIESRLGLP